MREVNFSLTPLDQACIPVDGQKAFIANQSAAVVVSQYLAYLTRLEKPAYLSPDELVRLTERIFEVLKR